MVNPVVGQALRNLRKNARFTQQEVADQLGLKNKSTLASWECGKAEPDILTFLSLCMLYGIKEADDLVKILKLENSAAFDFAAIRCEYNADKQNGTQEDPGNKKPYTFCPYCGEKLE